MARSFRSLELGGCPSQCVITSQAVPYLIALAFVTLCALGFVWYTRRIWFFRDPDHMSTEQRETVLRSPVYGRIAYIRRITGGVVESEK
jgi:hypothetical protein